MSEKPQQMNAAQAYGILAAAHADLVVENRLLTARLVQLSEQLASLQPPPPAEAVPADEPRPALEAVK